MIATTPITFVSQKNKDRFWNTVDKSSSPNGCWLWKGSLFSGGYGRHYIGGKGCRAHRVSFILSGGVFRNGLLVLHGCRNRHCVNPAHLYSGTQKQNCADKERDGTVARGDRNGIRRHPEIVKGESNGNARLTESIVRKIRTLRDVTGISYAKLGLRFGVSDVHIMDICKRKNWKHVV